MKEWWRNFYHKWWNKFDRGWYGLTHGWLDPWLEANDTAQNELRKFVAGSLDRLSTACFTIGAVGALGPFIGKTLGVLKEAEPPHWFGAIVWTFLGFSLHIIGEILILDIKEKK